MESEQFDLLFSRPAIDFDDQVSATEWELEPEDSTSLLKPKVIRSDVIRSGAPRRMELAITGGCPTDTCTCNCTGGCPTDTCTCNDGCVTNTCATCPECNVPTHGCTVQGLLCPSNPPCDPNGPDTQGDNTCANCGPG